jgi:hypothetical protein
LKCTLCSQIYRRTQLEMKDGSLHRHHVQHKSIMTCASLHSFPFCSNVV